MNKLSKNSIFDNFNELHSNIIIEDAIKAREFLSQLDIDSTDLSKKGNDEFKKLMFLAKAKDNQKRDNLLLNKFRDTIKKIHAFNADLAGELLKNTFHEKEVSFQFRNLEKWSDDELREVLGDIDVAKLLESFEEL